MGLQTEAVPHPRVQAALAAAGVPYVLHRHADCPFPIRSAHDFSRCLGRPVDVITKTLFLEVVKGDEPTEYALAVCPVPMRVDLELLARRGNADAVRLASREALARRLDYPPNGVSPLGGGDRTVTIDEKVFAHATVLVGAGVTGVEIEMTPANLQRACNGSRFAFSLE